MLTTWVDTCSLFLAEEGCGFKKPIHDTVCALRECHSEHMRMDSRLIVYRYEVSHSGMYKSEVAVSRCEQ